MMVWKCPPLHLPNWSNHWKWKQEMNATELANNLDKHYNFKKQFPQTADDVIATLRQQQAEIAELKNARDYWCLQYKDVFNKLEAKQND